MRIHDTRMHWCVGPVQMSRQTTFFFFNFILVISMLVGLSFMSEQFRGRRIILELCLTTRAFAAAADSWFLPSALVACVI